MNTSKLLFFTFLIISSLCKSQIPNYFVDGSKWRQNTQGVLDQWDYPNYTSFDYVYYIDGDTLIDSFVYKKIYERGIRRRHQVYPNSASDSLNLEHNFEQLAAIIKQEGKKVYIRTS